MGREREGGSLSLASVLRPPARQSINSSVHQFVSPCFLESAPPRSAAAQPSLWQTAVVKRCWSRAPSPANRRASPRRLRTPQSRAAREVPAQKGEPAGQARTGEVGRRLDGPAPSQRSKDQLDSETSWCGHCVEDAAATRTSLASRNSVEGVVASQSRVLCSLELTLNYFSPITY